VWSPYYRFFVVNGNWMFERNLELLQKTGVPRYKQILPYYENRAISAETIWFQQDQVPLYFGRQICTSIFR
jgi:hypothetical protein